MDDIALKELKELQEYVAFLHKGMMDLTKIISENSIKAGLAEVRVLDVKDNDTVLFSVPRGLGIDTNFFDSVQSMFAGRKIDVIVMQDDIKIDIVRKDND